MAERIDTSIRPTRPGNPAALRRAPRQAGSAVLGMKSMVVNVVAVFQIVVAGFLGLITMFRFEADAAWFLLGCILVGLVALGLVVRSRFALVTEFILLLPVCALLVFQTGRRVWGIFTGVWRDCPPAFFTGFMFEQIVLIPALCMCAVLLLCRNEFGRPREAER